MDSSTSLAALGVNEVPSDDLGLDPPDPRLIGGEELESGSAASGSGRCPACSGCVRPKPGACAR